MTNLARFVKAPDERRRYILDYTDWLDTDETVTSADFVVAPAEAGDMVVDFSETTDSTVLFYVNYGQLGEQYTVTVSTETSYGQIKQDTVLFTVREP